jgi:hypothetical protein
MRGKHRRIEYSLKEGPHDARSTFEPAIENRLKSQVDEQGKARQVIPMRADQSERHSVGAESLNPVLKNHQPVEGLHRRSRERSRDRQHRRKTCEGGCNESPYSQRGLLLRRSA